MDGRIDSSLTLIDCTGLRKMVSRIQKEENVKICIVINGPILDTHLRVSKQAHNNAPALFATSFDAVSEARLRR